MATPVKFENGIACMSEKRAGLLKRVGALEEYPRGEELVVCSRNRTQSINPTRERDVLLAART